MFCHKCGIEAVEEAQFCASCGAKLIPEIKPDTVPPKKYPDEGSPEPDIQSPKILPANEVPVGLFRRSKPGEGGSTKYTWLYFAMNAIPGSAAGQMGKNIFIASGFHGTPDASALGVGLSAFFGFAVGMALCGYLRAKTKSGFFLSLLIAVGLALPIQAGALFLNQRAVLPTEDANPFSQFVTPKAAESNAPIDNDSSAKYTTPSTNVNQYAKFVNVDSTTDFTLYVDISTAHRTGNKVNVWTMADYFSPITSNGNTYLSVKYQSIYNCKENQFFEIYGIAYSGHLGSGKVTYEGRLNSGWIPIPPDDIQKSLLELVCRKN